MENWEIGFIAASLVKATNCLKTERTLPRKLFLYLSRVFTNASSHLLLLFTNMCCVSLTSRRRRTRLPHWKQSRSSRIRLRSTLPFTLATSPSLRKEWWWTLYHSTPPIIPSSVSRPLLVFKGLISQKI